MAEGSIYRFNTNVDARTFRDFSFFNSFLFHSRWISLALFPLVMTGLGILNLLTGSAFLFRLFLVLALLIPVLYLIYYGISLRNQIRVNNLTEKRQVYTTCFTNGKIAVTNENENQPMEWEHIHCLFRYKEYFYLYITKNRAFILPAEDLDDQKSADAFWEYSKLMAPKGRCRSYIKSKKKID